MRLLIIVVYIVITNAAFGQNKTSKYDSVFRYGDFHAHTTLKNFYRALSPKGLDTTLAKIEEWESLPLNKVLTKGKLKPNINFKTRERRWTGNAIGAKYGKPSAVFRLYQASYNQTSFDKIKQGNGGFIFTSLYALEKQAMNDQHTNITLKNHQYFLLQKSLNLFGPFLRVYNKIHKGVELTAFMDVVKYYSKNDSIRPLDINYMVVTKMYPALQLALLNRKLTSNKLVDLEVKYLDYSCDNKAYRIVRDKHDLDSLIKLRNSGTQIPTLIFLSYEGGHNFYGKHSSAIDDIITEKCDDNTCKQEIYENIRKSKNGQHRLFMIGIGHLFFNKLAGASRGLDVDKPIFRKILNNNIGRSNFELIEFKAEEGFYENIRKGLSFPGQGNYTKLFEDENYIDTVSGFGTNIIDSILDNNNRFNKRSFVDMRHLDVLARKQLIEHYQQNYWAKGDTVPLVYSHGAYSGENYEVASKTGLFPLFDYYSEFDDYENFLLSTNLLYDYKRNEVYEETVQKHVDTAGWFHTFSNNLFTEEIKYIYQSNGMIGVTLEERALGATSYNRKKNKELRNQFEKYLEANVEGVSKKLQDSLQSAEPFVRNLFAFIRNSGEQGNIKSWQQLSIGTDFDGIMNPIDICPTAAEMPKFFDFLVTYLDLYIHYYKLPSSIKCEMSSLELMQMLFYDNLEKFTIKHF